MDFRLGSNLVRSNSADPKNGGSLASETDTDANKLGMYGLPPAKAPRSSPCGGVVSVSSQQIHSFSPLNVNASIAAFPFARSSSGPFTQSQWMELEHQALIYKYITANVPIPSYLLNPITKALQSSGLSCFPFLRPNALGWGGFHLGLSKADPEPGRCRRTDGKKWRCSRDAVADQKYCERHMNRGRHRSRKPVEAHSAAAAPKTLTLLQSTTNHTPAKSTLDNRSLTDGYPEFGSVCSDSLLNPLDRYGRKSGHHPLVQFLDEWPKSDQEVVGSGLAAASEQKSWVGGPLGEALHTAGECKALRGRGGAETTKILNVNGLLLPSLPALLR